MAAGVESRSGASLIWSRRRHDPIQELREVIHRLHDANATHVESVPVKETFQGQTIWDGIVEVFDLKGHPKANRAYAWVHHTDDPDAP